MEIENQENQPVESSGESAPSVSHETNSAPEAQDLVDLAKYSRVKLGDREIPREEIERGYMRQSDYTKKTQELAKERQYADNLQADLMKIARNPALATEFKRVYPSKYHGYLSLVQQSMSTSPGPSNNANPELQRVTQELAQVQQYIQMYEQQAQEQRVQQSSTEINSAFAKYSSKYPLATPKDPKSGFADESAVLTRAQAVLEGKPQGQVLTDKDWEKIFKDVHSHYEAAYKGYYKNLNNNQKAAHVRGKDMGSGGGIPGNAPNLPKNLKEATKLALQDLGSKN